MPKRICLTCARPFVTPDKRITRCPAHYRPPRRAGGTEWNKLRDAILERDRYTCRYCKGRANSADHVVPVERGGTDSPANLVAACGKCNSAKGTMTLAEFMESGWMHRIKSRAESGRHGR
jgi:5-methylcytosine-specific restriction endonuclease McrA